MKLLESAYAWAKIPEDLPRQNLILITAKTTAPTRHPEDPNYSIRIFNPKEMLEASRSLARRPIGINHIDANKGGLIEGAFTVDAQWNESTQALEVLCYFPTQYINMMKQDIKEGRRVEFSVEYAWREEIRKPEGVEFVGLVFDRVDLLRGKHGGDHYTGLKFIESEGMKRGLFEAEMVQETLITNSTEDPSLTFFKELEEMEFFKRIGEPLHSDFKKIHDNMVKKYGAEKGKQVFYAWINKMGYDETKPMSKGKKKESDSKSDEELEIIKKDIDDKLRVLDKRFQTIVESNPELISINKERDGLWLERIAIDRILEDREKARILSEAEKIEDSKSKEMYSIIQDEEGAKKLKMKIKIKKKDKDIEEDEDLPEPELEEAEKVKGYEPPEAGTLPKGGQDILAAAYASCRKDNPDYPKGRCSKIAWGAVKNAGYVKEDGKWMLKKKEGSALSSIPEINIKEANLTGRKQIDNKCSVCGAEVKDGKCINEDCSTNPTCVDAGIKYTGKQETQIPEQPVNTMTTEEPSKLPVPTSEPQPHEQVTSIGQVSGEKGPIAPDPQPDNPDKNLNQEPAPESNIEGDSIKNKQKEGDSLDKSTPISGAETPTETLPVTPDATVQSVEQVPTEERLSEAEGNDKPTKPTEPQTTTPASTPTPEPTTPTEPKPSAVDITQKVIDLENKNKELEASLGKLQEAAKTADKDKTKAVNDAVKVAKEEVIKKVESVLPSDSLVPFRASATRSLITDVKRVLHEASKEDTSSQ